MDSFSRILKSEAECEAHIPIRVSIAVVVVAAKVCMFPRSQVSGIPFVPHSCDSAATADGTSRKGKREQNTRLTRKKVPNITTEK